MSCSLLSRIRIAKIEKEFLSLSFQLLICFFFVLFRVLFPVCVGWTDGVDMADCLFGCAKQTVSLWRTLCSVCWNTLFQRTEHFVLSYGNKMFLYDRTKCSPLWTNLLAYLSDKIGPRIPRHPCGTLPAIFLAVRIEGRFSLDVILTEYAANICLVVGREVRLFPVEAVVFSATEVGDEPVFQRMQIFVRNIIEQMADAPRHMCLLCRLEVRTFAAVCRYAQWVDDADGRIFGRVADSGKAVQAGFGFCALGVEATWETIRCQWLFWLMFHIYRYNDIADKGKAFFPGKERKQMKSFLLFFILFYSTQSINTYIWPVFVTLEQL